VHACSLGKDTLQKQRTGKSLLLRVAFFSDYEPSLQGETMQSVGVWFLSAEKGYLNLWFYTEK